MPPTTPSSRPLLRRLSTVALAAILGSAALPAVDAAATATSGTASPQQSLRIPGLHEVKTHFSAITRRNVAIPRNKSGSRVNVTASDGTTASLVPAPPDGPARSTWVVNYDAGFTTAASGPQAQAAFQAAVDIWSHIVYSPVPIVVNASYADLGGNVLGQAAAAAGYSCPCIGDGVHVYPVALANALYGSDISPSNPDINAQFNSNPVAPFYYGTDGAPTSGKVDFESVVLHELGHGLGFAGSMTMTNGNVTYNTNPAPMKWDTFLVDGAGTSMVSYASGSAQLTTAMESPLYWSGADGTSTNGGTRPTMYAPATWQQGSSGGAHLDEATYGVGNANSLMSPSITTQEAVHSPGADAIAMFRDIGWNAIMPTGSAPAAPTGVTATRGNGSASVSWNASTDYGNAVTQYVATASPGGATCSTSGALNCTVNGLTNGTSYTFTVTATNSIGTSAASTASSAVVPAGTPATPSAPSGSPGDGSAVVSWTAPSNNGAPITGYDVQSSADNGTTWSTGLASARTSTATQATFTGLTNGTAYVFRVAAINSVGEGTMSPQSAAVTPAVGASAPGAPTNFTGTAGNGQVTLGWTAPSANGGSAITGYDVRSSTDGVTWSAALPSALTSTTTSAVVSSLTNGQPYRFRVAAINSVGTGTATTTAGTITPATVPGAPTNVTTTRGNTQAGLSWTAPSDNGGASITSYRVRYSTNGGTSWTTISATAPGSPVTVTGMTNGVTYLFGVAATNSAGTGAFSANSNPVTPATTPGAPTQVTGTAGDGQVAVSWTAPSATGGNPISGYDVEWSSDGGTTWSSPLSSAQSSTSTAALVTGLTNGTAYVFQVAARNGVGAGAFSVVSSAVTPASAPSTPTSVGATAGDQQATVSWTPASDGGSAITSYDVRYSSDGGTTWTSAGVAYSSSPATVTGLTNGTSYLFDVAAINDVGASAYSDPTSAVVPSGLPGTPTGVSATSGNGQATVSWTAPSANGSTITGYAVRYSSDGGTNWTSAGAAAAASPMTVTGLTNGTPYVFDVAAINANGTGSYSSASSAVTPRAVPDAPAGVSATAHNGSATVSWTAPADNGDTITAYEVRYSTNSGTSWTSAGTAYASSPVTVTGLTNGTSYVFDVAATNSAGQGAFSTASSSVTPATVPGTPTQVAGSAGDGQVSVSWTAPSSDGGNAITGYDVEWSSDGGTTWSAPLASAQSSTSTVASVTGLTNGTAYVFRVAATNGVGTGTFSGSSSGVTPATVPGAPTAVSATASDQSATVNWTAPGSDGGSTITSYDVRYSTDGGTSWTSVGVAYSSSPATVTGLTNGTSYRFDVTAINGVGASAHSDPTTAVVPAGVPGAPTAVTPTRGDGQASVAWTDPSANGSALTGFTVRYSSDGGTTWTTVGTAYSSSPAVVTGLVNGTSYVFEVAATNGVGTGAYSSASSTAVPAGLPAAPTGVAATRGNAQATVSWTNPAGNGSALTGFTVRYSTDNGSTWSAGSSFASSPATVTGLTNGTSYVFDVAATNGVGTGSYSTPSTAVVPARAPAAPGNGTATRDNASASVSWSTPADNGSAITSYVVRYSTDGTHWTDAAQSYDGSPATVTGLTNGTAYVFDVAAVNAVGTGTYSAASNSITPATAPDAPTGVAGTSGPAQVSVAWTPGANGGSAVTGYNVRYSTDSGSTWTTVDTVFDASPAVVTGLTNGTAYVFDVAAVNDVGSSAYSTASAAVTPAAVPDAPTGVSAERGASSATLSWTAPAANGSSITSYVARYSTDNGAHWTSVAGSYDGSPATVTGLTNGTAYVFEVAAVNGVGTGAYSAMSTAVTPATVPDAPTGVSGARAGDGAIAVTWTAASDQGAAITGYAVEWSSDSGTTWSAPLDSALTSTATAASVTGLTDGTPYIFKVAAINGVGTGAFSDTSGVVTPATVPAVPSGVSAVAGDEQAKVTWTAPANGGAAITSYDVRYSSDGGTTWTSAGVAFAGSPATVTGLTNGTAYAFEVAALNDVGLGGYSTATASVTPWRDSSSLTHGAATTVKYGTTLVVSTTLRDTTTGATMGGYGVRLLSRTSTALPWHLVTTVSTSWSGVAKASVKPGVRTYYMWEFTGVPTHAATSSAAQTVSVAQVVTVAATAGTIVHGGVVKFYGTVSPNEVNQYVYLQMLVGGSWKTTAVKATIVKQRLPNGVTTVGYVLALKTGSKGTFSYRVNRPATLANAAGVSKTLSLRVT